MMKSTLTRIVLGGTLLLGFESLRAQEPPPEPPLAPDFSMPGGFTGPRMEILGFGEMHPGKVVTGAPYSAVAITETIQSLADGNSIDRKVQSNVYRDSQGRTRRETTFPGQSHSMVMIHDPVASTGYVLHLDTKIAEQLPTPPEGSKHAGGLQRHFQAHIQEEIANGTLKKEDLGVQNISGITAQGTISAQGTRYTRTIPAGQIGNANPIIITNEQWYSADLRIVVKSTRNDPRFGQTTYILTNIQRSEPAASLFTVPADYTVKPATLRHGGRHGFGTRPAGSPETAVPPPPPGE